MLLGSKKYSWSASAPNQPLQPSSISPTYLSALFDLCMDFIVFFHGVHRLSMVFTDFPWFSSIFPWFASRKFIEFSMALIDPSMLFIDLSVVLIDLSMVFLDWSMVFIDSFVVSSDVFYILYVHVKTVNNFCMYMYICKSVCIYVYL